MFDFLIDVIEMTWEILKLFFCLGISLACIGFVFYLMITLDAAWPIILIAPAIAIGYTLMDRLIF